MPAYFYSFLRAALTGTLVLVCIIVFSIQAPSALADPHAVFYTDRAQEQLFYNVLAALNQADYVEPSFGSFPYARQNLVQNRAIAADPIPGQSLTPFEPENNPVINSTHTDLPSVVTRNITLEGNDLWTSYLVQQFSLETASRRTENELARVFCERALGIAGCDITSPYAAKEQSSAFETDTSLPDQALAVAAVSTLQSGTKAENDLRTNLLTAEQSKHNPGDPLYLPRPDDPAVSALNQTIEANNQTIGASAVSSIANAIIGSSSSGIDPQTFTDITVENGNVKPGNNIDTADKYLDKLQQIALLPAQLVSATQSGIEKQTAFLNNLTNTPELAGYSLEQQNNSGAVTGRITNPSGSQQAMLQALANLAVSSATSQKYTSSNDALNPGNQPLLTAPIASTAPQLGANALPQVSNLAQNTPQQPALSNQLAANTPSQNPSSGQVAGITSDQITNLYNTTFGNPPQTALSPSVRIGSPLKETGLFDALTALTNGTYRKNNTDSSTPKDCSFCVQMDSILKNADNTIGDVYCALFPNTESCFRRNPAVSPAP